MGFREMIPITTGVIPFGAVMGTVCANAKLSLFQTVTMNIIVYSGAAQLASIDLMTKHAATLVVVATGLAINLRFLLYSAAVSPLLQHAGFWRKFIGAQTLTDQSYAVMSANQYKLNGTAEMIPFYFGTVLCMWLTWHLSVLSGFVFGNFAPASWSLDYAVPLSFMALVIPTLKNRKYVMVAAFSSFVSVLLYSLPYKTSLIATAALSIALAAFLTRRKDHA
jgi:predicted branched-subunit amino acid permease